MIDFKNLFKYSEDSPSGLVWIVNRYAGTNNVIQTTRVGQHAGSLNSVKNYWMVSVGDKQRYLIHRIIWVLFYGEIEEGFQIDHIDGDGSNNKITNLRLVTASGNSRNMKRFKNNRTGVTGVCRSANGFYIASWQECGRNVTRKFSIIKCGEEGAFNLACQTRRAAIDRMNSDGAGYSERHGT